VTQAFLRFLGDQAENYQQAALDMWEVGTLDGADPQSIRRSGELRGRLLTVKELRALSASDIREFYLDKLVGDPVGVQSESASD
jgi:hypothetical protein